MSPLFFVDFCGAKVASIAIPAFFPEDGFDLPHHFQAQHDAVEYGHTPVESAQQAIPLMHGGREWGGHLIAYPCHDSFLRLDLLAQSGFLLHQLLQCGGDVRCVRAGF